MKKEFLLADTVVKALGWICKVRGYDENTAVSAAVALMAQDKGLYIYNPIANHPLTPEECTYEDMETICNAGYDLVIEDGVLLGWRKRDE